MALYRTEVDESASISACAVLELTLLEYQYRLLATYNTCALSGSTVRKLAIVERDRQPLLFIHLVTPTEETPISMVPI
jgi:hypothetical protein